MPSETLKKPDPLHKLGSIVLYVADLGTDFSSLDRASIGELANSRYSSRSLLPVIEKDDLSPIEKQTFQTLSKGRKQMVSLLLR